MAVVALAVATVERLGEEREQQALTECRNNMKNIGTAMEIYSTDWSGHYPSNLERLVPKYLQELPVCPNKFSGNYGLETGPESPHNTQKFQDYYYLYCPGESHHKMGLPPDYPTYDGVTGILER